MPGPKTHDIFYKELKNHLSNKTLNSFPNYDDYRLFAQGHDFLIYHNFYKIWNQKLLDRNIENSILLQENSFPQFVYNYLNIANNSGAIEEEQVRLFIGPGYVMHHLLDAYIHPFIIYLAGDHTRDCSRDTWYHGIAENLIDIYLMENKEKKDPKLYPVYKDFKMTHVLSSFLIETLDKSLYNTYRIVDGGDSFERAIFQTEWFMKLLKYDPSGIKMKLFDALDSKLKGTSSFSYHRDSTDVFEYLNLEHKIWYNPMDDSIVSNESFFDLYDKALKEGSYIVDELESICYHGQIKKDDIFSLIPNISSSHGLECGKKLVIKNRKK